MNLHSNASLNTAVRTHLALYVDAALDLVTFDAWFAQSTWDIEQHADGGTRRLVYGIEHRLAEYTNGDWTEQELRDFFRVLLGIPPDAPPE